MVAGGEQTEGLRDWRDDDYTRLSSTEILVTLAGVWRTVGPLPTAVWGLRGATLDNRVYMTGEWYTEIFIGHRA